VAGGAIRRFAVLVELPAVNILMTCDTLRGRVVEDDRARPVPDHRAVAFETPYGAVSSEQYEPGGGMVERRCFFPGARVVAELAALLGIAGRIAPMGILMTAHASE